MRAVILAISLASSALSWAIFLISSSAFSSSTRRCWACSAIALAWFRRARLTASCSFSIAWFAISIFLTTKRCWRSKISSRESREIKRCRNNSTRALAATLSLSLNARRALASSVVWLSGLSANCASALDCFCKAASIRGETSCCAVTIRAFIAVSSLCSSSKVACWLSKRFSRRLSLPPTSTSGRAWSSFCWISACRMAAVAIWSIYPWAWLRSSVACAKLSRACW